MVSSASFQTRARTIDHLGREQIADCPTAISELWKNAYDAYAENVELHIFDGDVPIAALVDDGHGMNSEEFLQKWLTVGTESKTDGFEINVDDRNGLKERVKQGQKGIGRLSCGALGSLLLLISKRKTDKFVASLIDWRLFENPFLYLHDIKIPITEFEEPKQLMEELPSLFDQLMGNVWGDGEDSARDSRLDLAWNQFSEQENESFKLREITPENVLSQFVSTKDLIVETLINDIYSEHHFEKWDVWSQSSVKGTAMFMANLHDDIKYQLSKTPIENSSGPEKIARERLFQTLSNFTDPFSKAEPSVDPEQIQPVESAITNFLSSVTVWNERIPRPIISKERQFSINNLLDLEHIIEGNVDSEGYFRGRVKAFGEWHEDYVVKPKQKYQVRRDSAFGAFTLRLGSYEAMIGQTTLPDDMHAIYHAQAEKYGGVMVYRDGLRVMPYGREDNDYFEIELRRTKNAGRYFWSNRRTFGRIAITRDENPNLKDKAGREGFLENRASKLFREIVENILVDVADSYLGSKSKDRKVIIKDVKEQKATIKAEKDRKTLVTKERKRVRASINKNFSTLKKHAKYLEDVELKIVEQLNSISDAELQTIKGDIDELDKKTKEFSLSPVPPNLGRLEEDYREYRKIELLAKDTVASLNYLINDAISSSKTVTDIETAEDIFMRKNSSLNALVTRYSSEGKSLLSKQLEEFNQQVKSCRERYKVETLDILEDLKLEKVSLKDVLNKLDEYQDKVEIENSQKLSPYLTAITRISEEIDLEGLAIHSMNESLKYREEIGRLHGLAQLGITVEIIGHEIEGLDMTISRGLKTVSGANLNQPQTQAYNDVLSAQQALSDKWRFLSPLKLSGEKVSRLIKGKEIFDYVNNYFSETFQSNELVFEASESFLSMSIVEQPARIYPVFINIVNNSQYWVERSEVRPKKITIDIINSEVVIGDTGPGVSKDDLAQLFTLFFTRKQRGGRGVGLYLSKQNLQAGGHKIRYEVIEDNKILPGANFAIAFKGLKND